MSDVNPDDPKMLKGFYCKPTAQCFKSLIEVLASTVIPLLDRYPEKTTI